MFTEIRIYFEGNRLLSSGFSAFFGQLSRLARDRQIKFRLISAGSGSAACRDFGIALKTHGEAWNILLKDSEGPSHENLSTSLCQQLEWDESQAESIFWMVEMMESWFHADKEALEEFYGRGFNRNALKSNRKVEDIPKKDLKTGLQNATRKTRAGDYFENKTSHGPKLLERTNPTPELFVVQLNDGRAVSIPYAWFPRLANATPDQRAEYELIGPGRGIHWPLIDEDLSVSKLLWA
jgi:hypothetical protein